MVKAVIDTEVIIVGGSAGVAEISGGGAAILFYPRIEEPHFVKVKNSLLHSSRLCYFRTQQPVKKERCAVPPEPP